MEYKDTYISNISEYLAWIKKISSADVMSCDGNPITFEHSDIYYRGQSCSSWNLKPSVFREPYLNEHFLLNKASLRLWNEVSSLNTYLEKMIYFQHYGLFTRLLDVTFNPLVALYVACCDKSKQSCNGVVYCGYGIERRDDNIAQLTAKYVFENELQQMVVGFQRFLKEEKVNINAFTMALFILPPINNPRIEAQNGAFIMAPLFKKVEDDNTALLNKDGLEETDFFDNRRAVISGCNKEGILRELSVLGIDSGTIYKSIEEKLKAIVTENKLKSNLF